MQAMELLLSDARGVYIPRDFVIGFDLTKFENLPKDTELLKDQEVEHYWDIWSDVLDNATYTEGGHTWRLHQDGDLWLICDELMSNEEYQNFFGEMKPAPEHAYEFAVCSDCMMAEANGDYSGMEDDRAEEVEASLARLHREYPQVIEDGAEYGFMNAYCECCGALPGDRFRLLAFKEPNLIGAQA